MRISIIGTGYVGSVTGACLAEMGHDIIFVGRDTKKLDLIKSGKSPIYEPGLEDLLQKNRKKISVTTDLNDAVSHTDITFICVGYTTKKRWIQRPEPDQRGFKQHRQIAPFM